MKNKKGMIVVLVVVVLALFLLSMKNIEWGKLRWLQAETITVTGEAKSTQKNQIASFTAGVNIIKDKKEDAVNEVNQKINDLIKAVKNFGIPEADIKTQNVSVYQQQEINNKQWVVNNSIEITLRDVDKANQLTDLLNASGANNVYGPNFRMDDTSAVEKTLYDGAIKDAKDKAEIIAKAAGRKLGKVIDVSEGAGGTNQIYPMMAKSDAAVGGGAATEIGTETVSQSLTVVFEIN